ncbi:MAG: hypothetical protein ACE5J6_02275 [Candidatus Bathyarchaeia archaeon]
MPLSLEKPSWEWSVGEILSRSFDLYSSKFVNFFAPFLLAGLVNEAFSWVIGLYFQLTPPPQASAPPEVLFQWLSEFLITLVAMLALTLIVTWIVDTIVGGVVIKYASDLLEKGEANILDGLKFTISRLSSLLAAGIITGILIVVGLICFVVPGIILLIIFALVIPVIMIEQKGALESLTRSRRLVSKRWGKTFILLLLIGIIFFMMGLIADMVSSLFGPEGSIFSVVIMAIVQPVLPIAMTLLYYSMIVKGKTWLENG